MLKVIKNRKIYYSISIVLTILSLIFLFVIKLNLWIDMTWWTQIEYTYSNNIDLQKVREITNSLKDDIKYEWKEVINNVDVYTITWEKKFAVISWFDSSINEKSLDELKINYKNKIFESLQKIDPGIEQSQYINVWKSFWDYIKSTAYLTLFISVLAIALYLAWAFSWILKWWNIVLSFSFIVILTLSHDLLVSAWFYVFTSNFLPDFKIDTFFITALLTILWFSVNDTIVIFDKIRTNLKIYTKKEKMSLDKIIDLSINETMTRSVYTSLMIIFMLFSILIFWPETIKWFVLTMIYWTLIWTYSSIFIASPLLYDLNKNLSLEIYEKKAISNEDKIIV